VKKCVPTAHQTTNDVVTT